MNDYLEHYGIRGMRWGIRRSEKQLANARGETKKTPKKKKTSKRQIKKAQKRAQERKLKKMSDEELKKRIARLQLEKQYKDLTKPEVNKGVQVSKLALASLLTTSTVIGTTAAILKNGTKVYKMVSGKGD